MRGEDGLCGFVECHDWETPPHARGRPVDQLTATVRFDFGNTPACAGKTLFTRVFFNDLQKHPRMRGEDPCALRRRAQVRQEAWKHPRMRGEDRTLTASAALPLETPPHARGRPNERDFGGFAKQKHPRMRGEDKRSSSKTEAPSETPPHARGRQQNPVPL